MIMNGTTTHRGTYSDLTSQEDQLLEGRCAHLIIKFLFLEMEQRSFYQLLVIVTSIHLPISYGIVGYDCGAAQSNITTISLLKVGECDLSTPKLNIKSINIQLLYLCEFTQTDVIQCKVEVLRTIFCCGMRSHSSAVSNGLSSYLQEISRDQCQVLHATGSILITPNIHLTQISKNGTTQRSAALSGSLRKDGTCKGTQYSASYGTWVNVVVQAAYTITLHQFEATLSLNSDKMYL